MTFINRFNPDANRVLLLAQEEAEKKQYANISPELLCLILVQDNANLANRLLNQMELDTSNIELELQQILELTSREPDIKPKLSEETLKVLNYAMESANTLGVKFLGSEHLLIGLLRHIGSQSYTILRRAGVTYNQVLQGLKNLPKFQAPTPIDIYSPNEEEGVEKLSLWEIFGQICLTFWALLAIMVASGAAAYNHWLNASSAVFIFVASGWVVSVSLHEFGHAYVAYQGGDLSVLQKGYLTLNPLKYSNSTLSILMPLLILLMGGIGLPGGAVYINMARIRNRRTRALVSAAGPMMTALFTSVLLVLNKIGGLTTSYVNHLEFWSGLAFLTFLQITALVFNLIPLPPLDGFGILQPYLPRNIGLAFLNLGRFTFMIIFFLFLYPNPVRDVFWQLITSLLDLANIHSSLVGAGYSLFQFWN